MRTKLRKKISCVCVCLSVVLLQLTLSWGSFFMTARADQSGYGEDAYYYMNYIQTNYPSRVVGTPNEKAMESWLIQEVTAMGYAPYTFFTEWDQWGTHYEGDAILFEKPGRSSRRIVVGAHYDCVDTHGADDNASGVGLLLETAKRMQQVETEYTIQFALFSIEEPGAMGSQYYVSRETQEYRDSVAVMINLDTIAAGDNMYIYGGSMDEQGNLVRTWGAYQALATAQALGLNMSFHPDVNENYPVPIKNTASDHMAYDFHSIPYIYFEASNWNGGKFNNFYQTADSRVPDGQMMHTWMDDLEFYNATFPGRVQNHLTSYSILLDALLRNLVEGSTESVVAPVQYTDVTETVYAVSDVNVRSGAGTGYGVLGILGKDTPVLRTGYNGEWSRIEYEGTTAYVASAYLSTEEPETTIEEITAEETGIEESVTEESSTEALTTEEYTLETKESVLSTSEEKTEQTDTSIEETALPEQEWTEENRHTSSWWIPAVVAGVCMVAGGGIAAGIIARKRRR